MKPFHIFAILFVLFLGMSPLSLLSQEDDDERESEDYVIIDPRGKKGFMFGVNLGYLMPNNESAKFYDGTPKGEGFLDLQQYLQIDYIRDQILMELGNSVSSYRLESYPLDMKYNSTISFGGHLRYQFNWFHAIVADVNLSTLKAADVFVISYDGDSGTSQDVFQNFEIQGKEERLYLSTGYHLALAEPSASSMNFEFGPSLTSISVKENKFTVGSRTYNILRAQTVGNGTQLLNNNIPTLTSIGGYAQLGANLEFDKFTVDILWRTLYEKVELSTAIEAKYKFTHLPFMRFVYRLSVKGI